ncbi:hypothetical protein BU15DRAFT_48289, partial [Melanogaster broomeanus]
QLAFSSVAMVLPIVVLRRYKASSGHVHPRPEISPIMTSTSPSTPPPRIRLRGHTLPSSPTPAHPSPLSRIKPTLSILSTTTPQRILPKEPAIEEDQFNAPLHSLKAFMIATTLVMSGAAASVAGIMSYLGVSDTAEFAARMRTWVSNTMPVLTAQIHRRLTPQDSLPNVLLYSGPSTSHVGSSSALPPFDHDEAEKRLAEAFDKGGFDGWVEVAAKEMEAEAEAERSRRSREGNAGGIEKR